MKTAFPSALYASLTLSRGHQSSLKWPECLFENPPQVVITEMKDTYRPYKGISLIRNRPPPRTTTGP